MSYADRTYNIGDRVVVAGYLRNGFIGIASNLSENLSINGGILIEGLVVNKTWSLDNSTETDSIEVIYNSSAMNPTARRASYDYGQLYLSAVSARGASYGIPSLLNTSRVITDRGLAESTFRDFWMPKVLVPASYARMVKDMQRLTGSTAVLEYASIEEIKATCAAAGIPYAALPADVERGVWRATQREALANDTDIEEEEEDF